MEEKYKQFELIDWSKEEKWQLYFSNITPTPPGNKIPYYKKKYFRNNYDKDFDITWEPTVKPPQQQY